MRAPLFVLHTPSGIISKLLLKRTSKNTKVILAMILVVPMTTVCQWGFAQQVNLSGLINQKHALSAAKPEYKDTLVPDVTKVFDTTQNDTASVTKNQERELKFRPSDPRPALSWETEAGKSYLIPALEIPVFILALNGFDRLAHANQEENGRKVYGTNFSTFWDNVVHGDWSYDNDSFHVNQFLHPYQGSIYHGLARSAGLNFWESLGYTFGGSFLWETGGETTHPSINDQVASGIAGSFFGEVLFRMSSLLLESG